MHPTTRNIVTQSALRCTGSLVFAFGYRNPSFTHVSWTSLCSKSRRRRRRRISESERERERERMSNARKYSHASHVSKRKKKTRSQSSSQKKKKKKKKTHVNVIAFAVARSPLRLKSRIIISPARFVVLCDQKKNSSRDTIFFSDEQTHKNKNPKKHTL